MNLGTLTASLGIDSSGLMTAERDLIQFEKTVDTKVAQMNRTLQSVGGQMKSIGKSMTVGLTLPIMGVGVAAFKMQKDFEASMSQVVGLVGVAQDQVDLWSKDIIAMAPRLGKAPKELADALFFVTSAGMRGAQAMEVLEMSAKASAAGLGETKTVADLVTSAINAYGAENISAAQATDILVASVREGKAEAAALAGSMGAVLPIAAEMGISFDQVGATMAAMTRTGTDASNAATQLRAIMASLLKPTSDAENALAEMGVSAAEMRRKIREEGLISALSELRTLTNQYGEEAMSRVFPNIRALAGVLDLMGSNAEDNIAIFDSLRDATGALDHAFETAAETAEFKWNQALASGQAALVTLGDTVRTAFIPVLERMAKNLERVTRWYSELNEGTQRFIVYTAGVAAALGPVMFGLGFMATSVLPGLIKMLVGATRGFHALRIAMLKNPFTAIAVAVTGLAVALLPLITRTRNAAKAQDELNDAMNRYSGGASRTFSNISQQMRSLGAMTEQQTQEFQTAIQTAISNEENAILQYQQIISQKGDRELDFAREWLAKREEAFKLWDQIQGAYAEGAVQEGAALNRLRNELVQEMENIEKMLSRDTMRLLVDTDERSLSQALDRLGTLRGQLQKTQNQLGEFAKAGQDIATVEDLMGGIVAGVSEELKFIEKMASVMGDTFDATGAKVRILSSAIEEGLRLDGVEAGNRHIANMVMELSKLDETAKQLQGLEIQENLSAELAHAALMAEKLGDTFDATGTSISLYESAIEDLIRLFPEGSAAVDDLIISLSLLDEQQQRTFQNQSVDNALSRLQNQLKLIAHQSDIMGDSFDATAAQAGAYQQAWTELINLGLEPGDEMLDKLIEKFKELDEQMRTNAAGGAQDLIDSAEKVSEAWEMAANVMGNAMADVFAQIGEGIAKNEMDFGRLVDSMLGGIQQIIQALLARAIAGMIAGEASKGLPGLITAAIGVGLLRTMWSQSVPKLAKGGIAYGSTMVEVGEYPGASVNPEVIAPLKDLQSMLGGGGPARIELSMRGPDMYGVWEKEHNKRKQLS